MRDIERFDCSLADRHWAELSATKPTIQELEAGFGGFSKPSKMPGWGYNLPAPLSCKVGSVLQKRPGSVCEKCYAQKGRYVFKECQDAMQRRLGLLRGDPERWAATLAYRLHTYRGKNRAFFRWHDSGDVLGPRHLAALEWIAEKCPGTNFWLPTHEYGTIARSGPLPWNLCARLSAPMVGEAFEFRGYPVSTVSSGEGHSCPAPKQEGQCGSCRACWDPAVRLVDYKLH